MSPCTHSCPGNEITDVNPLSSLTHSCSYVQAIGVNFMQ